MLERLKTFFQLVFVAFKFLFTGSVPIKKDKRTDEQKLGINEQTKEMWRKSLYHNRRKNLMKKIEEFDPDATPHLGAFKSVNDLRKENIFDINEENRGCLPLKERGDVDFAEYDNREVDTRQIDLEKATFPGNIKF